jgi:DNA-binding beta-propeller fold protein YncE
VSEQNELCHLFNNVINRILITLGIVCGAGLSRATPVPWLGKIAAADPRRQQCTASKSSMTPATWVTPPNNSEREPTVLVESATIPLPGPASRFDYQSVDPSSGRLYISHMNAGRLVVFDLNAGKVAADIPGVDRATGVLAIPSQHRVYVSAAGRHELVAIDDRTLKISGRAADIRFPDGIAYAPDEQKIFVSDESGEADVVVSASSMTKRSTIALGGEAGNTHYDSVSHCILVAVQTRNELVAIDPATEKIAQRYSLPGSDHPHGFAIDEAGRLAFVTGEGNATLQVVDLRTMKVLSSHRVGNNPDVIAWNTASRRLVVASESGVVTVFQADGPVLSRIASYRAPHAHSVAIDPRTHRIYLPLENVGGRPVLRVLSWHSPR